MHALAIFYVLALLVILAEASVLGIFVPVFVTMFIIHYIVGMVWAFNYIPAEDRTWKSWTLIAFWPLLLLGSLFGVVQ